MSIEAIIQSQRFIKNRDQFTYRMSAENGLDFDAKTGQYPKFGINIDPTVNSVLFPPQGPVKAQQHGLINLTRKQIKK